MKRFEPAPVDQLRNEATEAVTDDKGEIRRIPLRVHFCERGQDVSTEMGQSIGVRGKMDERASYRDRQK